VLDADRPSCFHSPLRKRKHIDNYFCLDNYCCPWKESLVQAAVSVLQSLSQASTVLDATRLRILGALREPGSAASVARALGLPRQRVGYHVRALEKEGLLRLIAEQRKRGTVERLVQTTARAYVVSPEALGALGATRAEVQDRFSSAYLLAATSRTLRDVGILQVRAAEAGKKLPTLTLETEVRFGSAEEQTAFAAELTEAVAYLAAKYHRAETADGRTFRFVFAGHPTPLAGGAPAAKPPPYQRTPP
jgi:DNA-binding transcriptional ArsR family regulator